MSKPLSHYSRICNLGKKKICFRQLTNMWVSLKAKCILGSSIAGQTREVQSFRTVLSISIGEGLYFSYNCYFSKKHGLLDLSQRPQRSLTHNVRWHSNFSKPSIFSHCVSTVMVRLRFLFSTHTLV